jgi:hypothetical protein
MGGSGRNWWWRSRRNRGLTCGTHMSVTREREADVVGRRKLKEKAHSREGAMGQAVLLGRRGRRRTRKRNGPALWPRTGLESKESLKSDLIFEFQWIFGIWQDFEDIYNEIYNEFGHDDFSSILLGFSRIFKK